MELKQLKLAVIGCDFLVYDMLLECLKPLPVTNVAICGSEAEMDKIGRQYVCGSRYADYRELLRREEPDIVLLFPKTGDGDAEQMARDCLLAGAYVFAERPVCQGARAAAELAALQQKTGRYIMPRYTRRHAPAYQMAREIISRPEFGRADMFIANYYASPYASERAMIWNHFSHIVDAMLYLVGGMKLLHADKIVRDEHRMGYNLSFLTDSGAIGVIQSGFTLCGEYPMERVEVTGDGRCVVVENIRELTYYRPAPARKYGGAMRLEDGGDALTWKQNYGHMSLFSYYGFEGCLEEIVAAAQARRAPSFHMEDALKVNAILEDIWRMAILRA